MNKQFFKLLAAMALILGSFGQGLCDGDDSSESSLSSDGSSSLSLSSSRKSSLSSSSLSSSSSSSSSSRGSSLSSSGSSSSSSYNDSFAPFHGDDSVSVGSPVGLPASSVRRRSSLSGLSIFGSDLELESKAARQAKKEAMQRFAEVEAGGVARRNRLRAALREAGRRELEEARHRELEDLRRNLQTLPEYEDPTWKTSRQNAARGILAKKRAADDERKEEVIRKERIAAEQAKLKQITDAFRQNAERQKQAREKATKEKLARDKAIKERQAELARAKAEATARTRPPRRNEDKKEPKKPDQQSEIAHLLSMLDAEHTTKPSPEEAQKIANQRVYKYRSSGKEQEPGVTRAQQRLAAAAQQAQKQTWAPSQTPQKSILKPTRVPETQQTEGQSAENSPSAMKRGRHREALSAANDQMLEFRRMLQEEHHKLQRKGYPADDQLLRQALGLVDAAQQPNPSARVGAGINAARELRGGLYAPPSDPFDAQLPGAIPDSYAPHVHFQAPSSDRKQNVAPGRIRPRVGARR